MTIKCINTYYDQWNSFHDIIEDMNNYTVKTRIIDKQYYKSYKMNVINNVINKQSDKSKVIIPGDIYFLIISPLFIYLIIVILF